MKIWGEVKCGLRFKKKINKACVLTRENSRSMRDSIIRDQTDHCSRDIQEVILGDMIRGKFLTRNLLLLAGKEFTFLLIRGICPEKLIELLL